MKLTICLVTKGREGYLEKALKSFEPFLSDPEIRVFLIDNGSDTVSRKRMIAWQEKYADLVTIHRFETNDSRYSTLWPPIVKAGIDWILMPGDDDLLQFEILSEWRRTVEEDPDLVAFASSAAIINENGILTGEVLSTTAALSNPGVEQVASAFHEPAFVWPSLFFRVSKVNSSVPASRYAFDWWVGINLLTAGKIKTTNSIGVHYRVHSGQESNLAPNRRKYFEGALWLDSFVRSDQFVAWAGELTDKERIAFWKIVIQRKPIYGDEYFARPLLFSIARTLMDSADSLDTAKSIAAGLALLSGVLLRDGESKTLVNDLNPITGLNPGNFRVTFADNSCSRLTGTAPLLNGGPFANEFQLKCKHSSSKLEGAIEIFCDDLSDANTAINADRVVSAITEASETRGDYEVTLSSGERTLVFMFRSLKKRLPGRVKVVLRKIKNVNLSKP